MIYACCDLQRREAVIDDAVLNGIDYLEVIDHDLPDNDPLRQRTLLVHCFKPLPANLSADNVQLLGGERIANVQVLWAAVASPAPTALTAPGAPDTAAAEAATLAIVKQLGDGTRTLVVRTAVAGDFSTYTLRLVASGSSDLPPANFDPRLRQIDFAFKVQCPSDFDCAPAHACSPELQEAPDIDYLAKDYPSFRRLLLDRMSQLIPAWSQTSEADYGMAVAELLAYACDQLSYQQDAVATEAYLGTARRRVSMRRHAVLVDYPMHDGCNARAWVQLQLSAISVDLPLAGTQFLSRCASFDPEIAPGKPLADAMLLKPLVFEAMLDPRFAPAYRQTLYAAHNQMRFYTWSDKSCCLSKGATEATLQGNFPNLQPGDALLFEERVGPLTGEAGDADPTHRHIVRLTRVEANGKDPLTGQAITEIYWAQADALPFALCVCGDTDAEHGSQYLDDISVARGNLVLVDHGQTISAADDTALGNVPQAAIYDAPACCGDRCAPQTPLAVPPRYRPVLAKSPLTQAAGRFVQLAGGGTGTQPQPFDPFGPAAGVIDADMADVLPQIHLESSLRGNSLHWQSQRSLLNSDGNANLFVVEVDDHGRAALRFGDNTHGMRPDSGTAFTAIYRIGNGTAGNVGAESIAHVVGSSGAIAAVRNPCAAAGGVDAEDAATVRRRAPQAFRTQQRAVTLDDYAAVAARGSAVQRATASMRWTGSWNTVFITVDPAAGADSAAVKAAVPAQVDPYRMAGVDLDVSDPRYVSLEIALHVCVKNEYFRSDVKQQLLQAFSNRRLPDGRVGLFHPDNYSFGQSVYLSRIYDAAHSVQGVAAVQVLTFQRQGTQDGSYLLSGKLPIGPFEIARLDNDPNYPEHGVLRLDIHGGK